MDAQAGLRLCCSLTLEDRFSNVKAQLYKRPSHNHHTLSLLFSLTPDICLSITARLKMTTSVNASIPVPGILKYIWDFNTHCICKQWCIIRLCRNVLSSTWRQTMSYQPRSTLIRQCFKAVCLHGTVSPEPSLLSHLMTESTHVYNDGLFLLEENSSNACQSVW